MNFKEWFILSEELYLQNNTATIFHRTPSFEYIQRMMNGGFTAGGGDHHGPGLYTTYTLEGTTNLVYGPYVVKLKVKNLKEYFILEPDVAKQIHGDNYKLKDQARILKLTLKLTAKQWQKYQEISESGQFGSAAASKALIDDEHFLWQHKCKGIVYNGAQDGKCICVYAPYEGLQFLAYAHAPPPTTVDFIEKNWIKSSKDASIRSISDLKFPNKIGSTSVEKQYQLSDPSRIIPSKILDDVLKGKYVKLKFYLKNNKLTGNNVFALLGDASDKEKMAEILGTDNINKLNGMNVYYLLSNADDEVQMARILGQNNIDKLTGDYVYILLFRASDKYETARILGLDNINKLTGGNVYNFISLASDKEKMAEILGSDNINKLTGDDVKNLLVGTNNTDEMARILGLDNINKLNGGHVKNLLYSESDKEKMARILGQENINKLNSGSVHSLLCIAPDIEKMIKILGSDNINKLTDDNISYFIYIADDKNQMKQILRKYYTGTNQEVISLLNK
jgi:hypothetical protein